MNKLEETKRKGRNTLIAIFIIGVAVYFGFTPLFESQLGGVAGAVIGSSFGAIFVIVLTMYLLNKQTEIEQESKRSEKVFEEKMKIYSDIFEKTEQMLDDGKISKNDEMKKLPFVMVRLLTVGSDQVISSFQEVYNSINLVFDSESEDIVELTDDERQNIMTKLSFFANTCRVDLGVSDEQVEAELYKKTEGVIQKSGEILKGKNAPLGAAAEITHQALASVSSGQYYLVRAKEENKIKIRIYEGDQRDEEKLLRKNNKDILRTINDEYELGHTEEDIKGKLTSVFGKTIIEQLLEKEKD